MVMYFIVHFNDIYLLIFGDLKESLAKKLCVKMCYF